MSIATLIILSGLRYRASFFQNIITLHLTKLIYNAILIHTCLRKYSNQELNKKQTMTKIDPIIAIKDVLKPVLNGINQYLAA